MKAKHIGNCFIIAGAACLLACLGWFAWLQYDDGRAVNDSRQAVSAVIEQAGKTDAETADDTEIPEESEIPQLPEVEIDGVTYIGYLSIPSVDLTMAVTTAPDDAWLKFALCRYYGSTYTSDLVICGHNYKSAFGKIKDLEPGDEVYFTDMDGNVTAYEVALSEVLAGTDIEGMTGSEYDLSLYTCTYGGQDRYTVRCNDVTPAGI